MQNLLKSIRLLKTEGFSAKDSPRKIKHTLYESLHPASVDENKV
jgi:hypothetical protein